MKKILEAFPDTPVGVDRTFNLGACFVTVCVYKNPLAVHNDSKQSPVFIGPLFMHWDATYERYSSYFSYIKMALGKDIHTETRLKDDLIIGSDDEKGLTKALHAVFNTAIYLLCTKHLKDNLTAYMKHKVGVTQKERI